jgi:DedD protein
VNLVMSKHRLIGLIVLAAIVIIAIQLLPSHQQGREDSGAITLTIPKEPTLSVNEKTNQQEVVQTSDDSEGEQIIDQHLDREAPLAQATEQLHTQEPTANPSEQYNRGWVVQLASYKDDKYAGVMVDKLKLAGYDAFTYKTVVRDAQVVRVYVGPVTSRQEAVQLTSQLTSAVGIKGIITRYEVDQI